MSLATQPLVVLVVEDEEPVRMIATLLLEDEGFCVLEAASAAEALSILRDHEEVSAVFTDIDMPPGQNGLALAHEIKSWKPGIGVVVTSGRRQPTGDALPPGAPFIGKPYDAARVAQLIRKATKPFGHA